MLKKKKRIDVHTAIDQEGEKKLISLYEKHDKDLEAIETKYKKDHAALMSKYGKDPGSNLKFWSRSKTDATDDPKFWILVNAGALKEFIKYGANKVLDQIRVRTHGKIEAREEIDKLKQQQKSSMDPKQVAYTLMLVAIFGAIAYLLITNFLNAKQLTDDLNAARMEVGNKIGELAVCRKQLEYYEPGSGIAPAPPPSEENTLEG